MSHTPLIVDSWVDMFNLLQERLDILGVPENRRSDYSWLSNNIHMYKDRMITKDQYSEVVNLIKQVKGA